MNERNVVKSVVGLLIFMGLLATGNTDLIYITAAAFFFAVCIAYAVWCERL